MIIKSEKALLSNPSGDIRQEQRTSIDVNMQDELQSRLLHYYDYSTLHFEDRLAAIELVSRISGFSESCNVEMPKLTLQYSKTIPGSDRESSVPSKYFDYTTLIRDKSKGDIIDMNHVVS